MTRYKGIQKILDHFVLYNSYLEPSKSSKNWIKPDLLYAEKSKGGYGQIEVTKFFKSIKTSWIKRYATGRLDDHWCDIIDLELGLEPHNRETLYTWGANKFTSIISKNLPCISEFIQSYQEFSTKFSSEPTTIENRWLNNPFFYNPKILHGVGRAKRPFNPGMFGLDKRAATLSLGQLFVNLEPITIPALDTLGFRIPVLGHNSLTRHLKNIVGHGKLFDAYPTKVILKYDRSKPIPCHLIDNISDYMKCFKKGSSTIRKIFNNADSKKITYDIEKFSRKINGDRVSINQLRNCFISLQSKYLSNDYLDYKSRAVMGKTQFNNCLAKYQRTVQKWCSHCLGMGIRTIEDFEHATFSCPQVQYLLHRVQTVLNLNCNISSSICCFSCPRPPQAKKAELEECKLIDLIWTVTLKITLKARSDKSDICDLTGLTELQTVLEGITRNFPNSKLSQTIVQLGLKEKICNEINQN